MTRAKTDSSLKKNLSKLTTVKTKPTPTRKTRSDKKPVFTKVKSDAKWELCNGNGNCSHRFPWYLEPTKKDAFNKTWLGDYEEVCKHITNTKLRPEEYTLWHYQKK